MGKDSPFSLFAQSSAATSSTFLCDAPVLSRIVSPFLTGIKTPNLNKTGRKIKDICNTFDVKIEYEFHYIFNNISKYMRIPGKCMLKLMKSSFGRKRHNTVITYESNYFVTQKSDTPGLADMYIAYRIIGKTTAAVAA